MIGKYNFKENTLWVVIWYIENKPSEIIHITIPIKIFSNTVKISTKSAKNSKNMMHQSK